jgi:hypothetical protein
VNPSDNDNVLNPDDSVTTGYDSGGEYDDVNAYELDTVDTLEST